jgi:general secretion pathway protein C
MQNIKYHLLNTISILVFSYLTAITINQFFKFDFIPSYNTTYKKQRNLSERTLITSFDEYKTILESGFFKLSVETDDANTAVAPSTENITDLFLLGTITGPSSIARAMIKKRTEREAQIFKLWSDVYGYKLVRINNTKAYLKMGNDIKILDMYAQVERGREESARKSVPTESPSQLKRTISRSEIQQKVLNNMDNALRGIRAGPYRVDGKIEGYKIFRIRPYNILYKFGARDGDILKRVNGHAVDSTKKLYKMWESLKDDPKITVDLERNGKLITYDFTISE